MIVTPEYLFRSVSHITPEFLLSQGVRGLVLDVDNTLTGDESQTLDDEVREVLEARLPLYRDAAHHELDARQSITELCLAVRTLLRH